MTQDTIKTRLRAARKLIDQPEKWTKGALKRDARGNELIISHIPVASRCASGAIMAACEFEERREVFDQLSRSINHYLGSDYDSIVEWNDRPMRTHAQVMQAFDRAIGDTQPFDG